MEFSPYVLWGSYGAWHENLLRRLGVTTLDWLTHWD